MLKTIEEKIEKTTDYVKRNRGKIILGGLAGAYFLVINSANNQKTKFILEKDLSNDYINYLFEDEEEVTED